MVKLEFKAPMGEAENEWLQAVEDEINRQIDTQLIDLLAFGTIVLETKHERH